MDDEFKIIKFRKGNITYTAHAIDLSGVNTMVGGNFMKWTAAFRIYDDEDTELVGKITFQQSLLLDYLWADPNQKRFPTKEYLEEALANLLHYLPFDKDTLIPEGDSFTFRFIRDLEDGRVKDKRIYNIKVVGSLEKTYQRIIFGDEITDDKLYLALLEPLYMQRLRSYATNLPISLIRSIFPFDQNKIDSTLEFLEYKHFVDVLRDASGVLISVKIRPEGVEFVLNVKVEKHKPQGQTINKIQIGHNIKINTGDNSPVNVNADIDTSFKSIREEIEVKNLPNKKELLEDLGTLQNEIKSPKDLDKIKTLLGKIGKASAWVGRRIEPIVQQVIASYLASQLPLPPIK